MTPDAPDRPVLAYASAPDASRTPDPHLRAMRVSRRIAALGLAASLAGLCLYEPLAIGAAVVLAAASIAAIAAMFAAASREFGRPYAVRHLILALALLPPAFLGVFLITRLVEADIVRGRIKDHPPGAED